jgi:hypothetical protein
MACFWGLVAGLAAAAGTGRHRLDLGRGSSVVVLSGPGPVQAGVRKCSHRAGRPAAVSAPICPAGRNIHRRTARSRPGHRRSRSTVAAGRNERRSQPAAGAGPAVNIPARSAAAAVAGGSGRIAVAAGRPWRRYRLSATVASNREAGDVLRASRIDRRVRGVYTVL